MKIICYVNAHCGGTRDAPSLLFESDEKNIGNDSAVSHDQNESLIVVPL